MVSYFFYLSTYKFSKNASAEISLSLIFLWIERISFSSIGRSFFDSGRGAFPDNQSGTFCGVIEGLRIPIPEDTYVVCPHFGQVTEMVKCCEEISKRVISASVISWCKHSLHENWESVFLRSAWKRWNFIQNSNDDSIILYFLKNSKYFSVFV